MSGGAHKRSDDPRTNNMTNSTDLPLTLADLERVRADLQESIRHTEEMLQRTEALLLAAALLKDGIVLQLMEVEDAVVPLPRVTSRALEAAIPSTN